MIKRRSLSLMCAFAMVLSLLAVLPAGLLQAFALGGTGTQEDPYQICTYNELRKVIYNNSGTHYAVLMNDIIQSDNDSDNNFRIQIASSTNNFHLDLAGHKLSRDASNYDIAMFEIYSTHHLYIDDSVGGGTIECELLNPLQGTPMFVVKEGGYLIINGGTFNNRRIGTLFNTPVISVEKGNAAIYGGTFSSYHDVLYHTGGSVYIDGATFITKNDAGWYEFSLSYKIPSPSDKDVTRIDLTAEEPRAGASISRDLTCANSVIKISSNSSSGAANKCQWKNYFILILSGTFKAGSTYTRTFYLKSSSGQDLADIPVYVNSKQAKFVKDDNDGWYEFTMSYKIPKETVLPGDVDGNSTVNMQDYALLQRWLANWSVTINEKNSDMDGNGTVNMQDYALLQRKLAGWTV